MPDATDMAGVDMRLEPGGYRELHWHVAGEWSLVLNGSCRIQVSKQMDYGDNFSHTHHFYRLSIQMDRHLLMT